MKFKQSDNDGQKKRIFNSFITVLLIGIAIIICAVIYIYFASADSREKGEIENVGQIEILVDMYSYYQNGQTEDKKIEFSNVAVHDGKIYYINSNNNICSFDISMNEYIVKEKRRVEKFVIYNDSIYYLNRNGEQYDLFMLSFDFNDQFKVAERLGNKEGDWYLVDNEIYYSKNGKGFCKYNLTDGGETIITPRTVFDFVKVGKYYFVESPEQFRSFLYGVKEDMNSNKIMNNYVASFNVIDNMLYFTNNEKLFSISFENNSTVQIAELTSNRIFAEEGALYYMDDSGAISVLKISTGERAKVLDAAAYKTFDVLGKLKDSIVINLFSEKNNKSTIFIIDAKSQEQKNSISFEGEPKIMIEDGYVLVIDNEIKIYDENLNYITKIS